MDPRLQRRVQRYGWDKAAEFYEEGWEEQLEPAQSLMMEMAALMEGERVLDVACGTGLVTFRAAEAVGPGGEVVGTDISQSMVDTAAKLAAARGFAQVSFKRMDAERLAVDDESFDAALCALGLMYYPDPVKALTEMRRALKPGGRTAVAVWGHRERCGWAEIFPIVDSRVNTEVCPLFFQLGSGDGLAIALDMAGFAGVEVERISTTLLYESEESALGAVFAGGPVAMAYSRFDAETRDSAHADYLASIESYRRGVGYEIPGEFVVARGHKGE